MYLEIAQIDVRPGAEADFQSSMSEALPKMERAKGCRKAELYRCVEKPERYRLLIAWDSIEEHVAFRTVPDAATFKGILDRCATAKESDHNTRLYPGSM